MIQGMGLGCEGVSIPPFQSSLQAEASPIPEGSQPHLTESVYKIVLQKSTPVQIRQFISYVCDNEGRVDEFVRRMIFAKTTVYTLSVR
jgi:hypothetical protein